MKLEKGIPPLRRRDEVITKENSNFDLKLSQRLHYLSKINENPKILDVCCGKGKLWDLAYSRTQNYLGMDLLNSSFKAPKLVGNHSVLLKQKKLDVASFDVFDIDHFGSPWHPFIIICSRLRESKKSKHLFFITDGTGTNAIFNSVDSGWLRYMGFSRHRKANVQFKYRQDFVMSTLNKGLRLAGFIGSECNVIRTQRRPFMFYIAVLAERV